LKFLQASAVDKAGNVTTQITSDAFVLDNPGGPLITIEPPSEAISYGQPISYTVEYTYADTITLNSNDIELVATGDADAEISVSIVGSTATVIFYNFTGEGNIYFNIAAGSAADSAGDLSAPAGPSAPFEVDIYGPEVVFGNPSPFYSVSGPATIPFEFVDAVSVSLLPSDVVVTTTGTGRFLSAIF